MYKVTTKCKKSTLLRTLVRCIGLFGNGLEDVPRMPTKLDTGPGVRRTKPTLATTTQIVTETNLWWHIIFSISIELWFIKNYCDHATVSNTPTRAAGQIVTETNLRSHIVFFWIELLIRFIRLRLNPNCDRDQLVEITYCFQFESFKTTFSIWTERLFITDLFSNKTSRG